MIHLDYRDSRPIYTQIVDGFREKISAGVLGPGDRLPSVRELAGELTINPNTIQRAYRQLENEGWIASVPGKGSFVCDNQQFQQLERDRLFLVFDDTTNALLTMGETRDGLAARLTNGGKSHA